MNIDKLQEQLASLKQEKEQAMAMFYRAEGAILVVENLLKDAEAKPTKTAKEVK